MKETKKPNILLVADYSNFHATLAKGLRKIGCDVTLVSDGGSFMKCARDIDMTRKFKGKFGGLLHTANLYRIFMRKMRGYDIVSFRDPQFLELRPRKIEWFFNLLVKANSNCFLSYLTTDIPFLDMLEAKDSPLRYSEWFIEGEPNRLRIQDAAQWHGWHGKDMQRLTDTFYGKIKGAVTALYEYHLAAERVLPKEKIAYGGIPIDVDNIQPQVFDKPRKIRIFLGRDYRRKLQKGSDLMEIAASNVVSRNPDKAELVILENKPRQEYMEVMRSCHIMLDQMYAYTPATMALEGMASGLTAVTGAEPQFYDFIGERENFPIVNSPIELEPLEQCIEELVNHPEHLHERSIRGREFVEKHNRMETVAKRFLDFWQRNI